MFVTISLIDQFTSAIQNSTNPKNGAQGLVMGPCIVKIDRIIIRYVQYQFEVDRCRNEEYNYQGSSANSVLDNTFFESQSQEISDPWSDQSSAAFPGSSAKSVGEDSDQDGQTADITS
ncbi:hypothetical protein DPMN_019028 [Dreissena polymorpha]|uniref:Uncharacterized protein n=1 Tax=Dreissena polymorpha TaxID=45954 RepID=A0A9D4S6X3_DREPO|nr:hypothetical protein DPMN_019028 [Dreissena polymorpha]